MHSPMLSKQLGFLVSSEKVNRKVSVLSKLLNTDTFFNNRIYLISFPPVKVVHPIQHRFFY